MVSAGSSPGCGGEVSPFAYILTGSRRLTQRRVVKSAQADAESLPSVASVMSSDGDLGDVRAAAGECRGVAPVTLRVHLPYPRTPSRSVHDGSSIGSTRMAGMFAFASTSSPDPGRHLAGARPRAASACRRRSRGRPSRRDLGPGDRDLGHQADVLRHVPHAVGVAGIGPLLLAEPESRSSSRVRSPSGPRNEVCGFTRFAMTIPSASSWAMRSTRTAARWRVARSPPRPSRSGWGSPPMRSVTPRCSSTSRCPSAVPPPWLPIAGMTKGTAPRLFSSATMADRDPDRSLAMPTAPHGHGDAHPRLAPCSPTPGRAELPSSTAAAMSANLGARGKLLPHAARAAAVRTPFSSSLMTPIPVLPLSPVASYLVSMFSVFSSAPN